MKTTRIAVLALLLVFILISGLSACAPSPTPRPAPEVQPTTETPVSEARPTPEVQSSDPSSASDLPWDWEQLMPDPANPNEILSEEEYTDRVFAMMPALDSLMRMIDADDLSSYKPLDPEFFWNTLYIMGVNFTDDHPFIEMDEDYNCIVPRKGMQEMATALFAQYDDLLPLPQDTSVFYNEGLDTFILPGSDMGFSYTKIEEHTAMRDGSVRVRVCLYDYEDESIPISTLIFTLVPNEYVGGIMDAIYYYSVQTVQ